MIFILQYGLSYEIPLKENELLAIPVVKQNTVTAKLNSVITCPTLPCVVFLPSSPVYPFQHFGLPSSLFSNIPLTAVPRSILDGFQSLQGLQLCLNIWLPQFLISSYSPYSLFHDWAVYPP